MDKVKARLRRTTKSRARMKEMGKIRLVVNRTPKHIYAQLIGADGKVLAVASTLEQGVRKEIKNKGGNISAAKIVGKNIAERGVKAGVSDIAFDRSGFKYHGRLEALAEAAREHGLKF